MANGLGRWDEGKHGISRAQAEQVKLDTERLMKENPDLPRKELKKIKSQQGNQP